MTEANTNLSMCLSRRDKKLTNRTTRTENGSQYHKAHHSSRAEKKLTGVGEKGLGSLKKNIMKYHEMCTKHLLSIETPLLSKC